MPLLPWVRAREPDNPCPKPTMTDSQSHATGDAATTEQIPTVRFELPDHVSITSDEFDGRDVRLTYDSNYGGSVTIEGTAEIDTGRYPGDWTHLVVEGRKIRQNGHVFSDEDDRHLGTVESVTVTVPHDIAVELVTDGMSYDVDRNDDGGVTVVQGWDRGVMNEQGFMEGTMSISLPHL